MDFRISLSVSRGRCLQSKSKKNLCIVLIIGLLLALFVSCNQDSPIGDARTLNTPNNLHVQNDTLYWSSVDYASGYVVRIDAREEQTSTNSYSLAALSSGKHSLSVKAIGDGVRYNSSAFSAAIEYSRIESEEGTFDSFDEINTRESYIGYGINIIEASEITSKNIKVTYPIFNTEKLMDERLIKSNEHYNAFTSIEGRTIEEYNRNQSTSASITSGMNASAKASLFGAKVGASASFSVGISTRFKATSKEVESQYFLDVISENQNYWLILQTSESRYKELLADEFKRDLYDASISPARLFDKYGTHLLTSVAMGGNIAMYYTLYSYEKDVSLESYASLTQTIKSNIEAAYGGIKGSIGTETNFNEAYSYAEEARVSSIQVDKRIICAGGGTYGINNEETLYANYFDWQKSLDTSPVVIGIKDSNSLYPIWELLDTTVEGAASRYEELYSYFQKYGNESYDYMCEKYSITPSVAPTEISNVCIDGRSVDIDAPIEVKAGTDVRITFDVDDLATKYSKTFSLCDEGARYTDYDETGKPVTKSYVTFDSSSIGTMIIDSSIPVGTMYKVRIAAGNVSKVLTFSIMPSYNVSFNTRFPDISVRSYQAAYGTYIPRPNVSKEGYRLIGWFTDSGNKNEFDFDTDTVEGNLVLYAKWEAIMPIVTFDYNGSGQDSFAKKVEFNSKVDEPSTPVRKGYRFTGWFWDPECASLFDFDTPLLDDMILYAGWDMIKYRVEFVVDKDSYPSIVEIDVSTDFKVMDPKVERQYYTLEGWYRDAAFSEKFSFDKAIGSDLKLYAKWTPTPIRVIFVDQNGEVVKDGSGAYFEDQTTDVTKGFKVESVPNPVKAGSDFNGWYFKGRIISSIESFSGFVPTDDVIKIVAVFGDSMHTITIDYRFDFSVGGATLPESRSIKQFYGTEYSVVHPEIKGYETPNATTGTVLGDETITVSYKLKSYDLTVRCVDPNGKLLASKVLGSVRYNDYYCFDSIEIDGYIPDSPSVSGIMDGEGKTVTVQYSFARPVTITFDANGGNCDTGFKKYKCDSPLEKLPVPTRRDYLFEGWYTDDGTLVTERTIMSKVENVTLYAHWIENNLYMMNRKSVALNSYYDSKTEEPSADKKAHHNNWELGMLEVVGLSDSRYVAAIRDERGFVINYKLLHDINNLPNPRGVSILMHCLDDDGWDKGFREYDCMTKVNEKIGLGTCVVRVEYEDGKNEEFIQTGFLAGLSKGQSKEIFSSSQLDASKQLRRIHVMVVYETFHSFNYGLFNAGWAGDYVNWMCRYDFDF